MESGKKTSEKITAASLLVAAGIIYGDIGTSPLYALKAIVGKREINDILVLGGISCIFWTLVFQTTIKYVWLTLKADNEGEGGVFSLYSLVRRYGKFLVFPTILGATTMMADGIITPPISVASAMEGLTIFAPAFPTVPAVAFIISLLFFFQRFGTQKMGTIFGPVMVIWFLFLFVAGIAQIAKHPWVLKGLNPKYAVDLLVHYPHGFWLLGAVFLCSTGAEALYADLGHCGKKNIRITWPFVKICLLANYFGQAAWMLSSGNTHLSGDIPFYQMLPEWAVLPGIVIATSAAIIASQALITGSYTLINEAMNLNFWPRVTVKQPSELRGQIYIPSVNVILWVGCMLMLWYFETSEHMEAAYGFSLTITMMTTTVLLGYFLRFRRKWPLALVIFVTLLFGTIEVSFFIANAAKIKERWMFLFFELGIFTVMFVCYYARKINNKFTRFTDVEKYKQLINELSVDDEIPKFSTHLIYLTKATQITQIEEKVMKSIFAKKPKRADIYWFVHINRTESPYTLSYDVAEIIDDRLIRVNINVGFRVQPKTELYFKRIVFDLVKNKELNLHIRPDGSSKYNSEPDFKFVVIEKFLSVENEFTLKEGLILNIYFFLKRLGQSDEKAFGLDKSDVAIEQVPLIYQPAQAVNLSRSDDYHHKHFDN